MFAFAIMMTFPISLSAQVDTVVSKVYSWNELKQDGKENKFIAKGSGAVLAYMDWHTTTGQPGGFTHPLQKHEDEELIIIKEGQLKVTINDSSQVLGPGSVALFIPGDEHVLQNTEPQKQPTMF